MSWYTGRIAEIERSADGPWARMRLDDGTRLYIREDRLQLVEDQFGTYISETRLRFRANPLFKRVQEVELVEAPPGWGYDVPFHPDPNRPTRNSSPTYAAILTMIVESIPPAPPQNGIQISQQRARRFALGVLAAGPDTPYFPDPQDERDSYLLVNTILRSNPALAQQLAREARLHELADSSEPGTERDGGTAR